MAKFRNSQIVRPRRQCECCRRHQCRAARSIDRRHHPRDEEPERRAGRAHPAYQREHGVRFGEAAIALGAGHRPTTCCSRCRSSSTIRTHRMRTCASSTTSSWPRTSPFSQQAEAFRAIRSQLMMRLFSGDSARCALAVVSPDSGDGKTFFSANLAVALSQLGGRTLLVDADLRGPRQHEAFRHREQLGTVGAAVGACRGERDPAGA